MEQIVKLRPALYTYLTYLTLGETIEILKQRNFNRKEDFILANTRNPVVEICKLKHNRMKSDMK